MEDTMQAAKQIEREYQRKAEQSLWAEPDTLTFKETADDGVFEVYAKDGNGDIHLIGFEDVRGEIELDVDEMLHQRGLEYAEITEMHREMMQEEMELYRNREKLGWNVLGYVEAEAPGFDGYLKSHRRLIFTGRARRRARVPAGIGPGMLDDTDRRRLANEIDMRLQATDSELVAQMGKNAVVVDTRFDISGRVRKGVHGETKVLNAPIEELRSMGVEPSDVFVVDQQNAKTLFISEGDYYYRGSLSESGSDPYADGWIAALDRPAESVNEVLKKVVRPDSVIAAEEAGLDVKRQGDWFFIEQHDDFMPTGVVRSPELQPDGECDFLQNHAAEWLGMDALNPQRIFVKGEVRHMNDDHETLDLGDQWWTAQHNGVDSRSFECEEFDAETQDRGMYSHPESHGGML